MIEKTKALEAASKVGDFIEAGIVKNGGEFFIRFDDVEQMNEFCAFVGLPQCEHYLQGFLERCEEVYFAA